MNKNAPKTIDAYIKTFPTDVQTRLDKMRLTIRKAVPKAEETISYSMPAFRLGKILIYFAGFKNHIGFFPTAAGVAAFEKELTGYAVTKGTVRFPHDAPIPYGLVARIARERARQVQAKVKAAKMNIPMPARKLFR